ncbi:hypothetical protein BVRB_1g016960 [Beta vulgaris subsp. vulgaris]|nr:hypothetical protein BVRB_1g016960 [Beta vulgaris subsp. vulgaris]
MQPRCNHAATTPPPAQPPFFLSQHPTLSANHLRRTNLTPSNSPLQPPFPAKLLVALRPFLCFCRKTNIRRTLG